MSWRAAFLRQAASDDAIRRMLISVRAPVCHQLPYLQMVTEKLAKGLLQGIANPKPPIPTHSAFVRLLQVIKTSREYRRHFGFTDARSFRS